MLVSIIIPCYNVENYLEDCVRSVLAQTYEPLEIIFVDNNSTDETLKKLEHITAEHSDRMILLSENQKGATYARNKGLRAAKGTYIQFWDADDLLSPDKIKDQVALVIANGFPDMVVASYSRLTITGEKIHKAIYTEDAVLALMINHLGCTCSNLFKRELLMQVNGFQEGLKSSQEYELMFRLIQNKAIIIYDNKSATIARDREKGSIMQQNPEHNITRFLFLRNQILQWLLEQNTGSERMKKYYQCYFDALRSYYEINPKEAFRLYKEIIPKGFQPEKSLATSPGYALLFKIFGFKGTERIKKIASYAKKNN